ncbi:hypothetical protein [Dehalococcoides mccartyi]|uniref:hypothetical protein n=1 Tax=Dehalococcoides mccartyi TaxID=61435 RepID=UPI0006BC3F7E|nr:hypothetical protein [Dehalococcoides mccartyi]BAS31184.1 hypothetical protein IBK_0109 [Dehalococcoides mccartyi IBARAKI]
MVRVYLSGGMNSEWQEDVMKICPKHRYFNPKVSGHKLPSHYKVWDIFYVKESDIVFAYMEKTNPSGYGLACEIGYAKALGKTVVLVDEKQESDAEFSRYFAIVRELADVVFENLDDGVRFLNTFDFCSLQAIGV